MKNRTVLFKITSLLFACLLSSYINVQKVVIQSDLTNESINFAVHEITIALKKNKVQLTQKSILEPFGNTAEKYIVLIDMGNLSNTRIEKLLEDRSTRHYEEYFLYFDAIPSIREDNEPTIQFMSL